MTAGKRIFIAATVAAGLAIAAASAGAQANGTTLVPTGFRVENLLMELALFLPEEYASVRGSGGPGGQPGQAQQGPQVGQQGQGQQVGQRPGGASFPAFKRDAMLMLTAAQVDALLPMLQELLKAPFPTPSQAKKVTSVVDATLTKQQKDAYEKYAKERDKAIEELRKQYQSRTQGTQGGAQQGGPGAQGQQQRDPAEQRKRMLEAFIRNLMEYRKGIV